TRPTSAEASARRSCGAAVRRTGSASWSERPQARQTTPTRGRRWPRPTTRWAIATERFAREVARPRSRRRRGSSRSRRPLRRALLAHPEDVKRVRERAKALRLRDPVLNLRDRIERELVDLSARNADQVVVLDAAEDLLVVLLPLPEIVLDDEVALGEER